MNLNLRRTLKKPHNNGMNADCGTHRFASRTTADYAGRWAASAAHVQGEKA